MRKFSEVREQLNTTSKDNTVVIANGHDRESIKTAILLKEDNIANSIIVGKENEIRSILEDLGNKEEFEIINAETDEEAAYKTVQLIREKKGNVILKGHIQTGILLKAVLNREEGIRDSELLSHVGLLEIPGHHKLLGVTDGALVIEPTLEQKKVIIENAVSLFNKLGYEKPKVAILEANEEVNPRIPTSVEAEELMKLQQKGEIKNCVVDGPISADVALDPEAAKAKNYESEVAGDADITVAPNIALSNTFAKGIMIFGKARIAGVIFGAKCPIVNVSRASTADEKYDSTIIALAVSK